MPFHMVKRGLVCRRVLTREPSCRKVCASLVPTLQAEVSPLFVPTALAVSQAGAVTCRSAWLVDPYVGISESNSSSRFDSCRHGTRSNLALPRTE
jgi:hypothetical protein